MPMPSDSDDTVTLLPVSVELPSENDLPSGTRAGSFAIASKIGRGGSGTVYLATHAETGRRVAVKVLHPFLATDARAVERFEREVRAVNRIRHPAILEVIELGRLDDGRPYFAMDLL